MTALDRDLTKSELRGALREAEARAAELEKERDDLRRRLGRAFHRIQSVRTLADKVVVVSVQDEDWCDGYNAALVEVRGRLRGEA